MCVNGVCVGQEHRKKFWSSPRFGDLSTPLVPIITRWWPLFQWFIFFLGTVVNEIWPITMVPTFIQQVASVKGYQKDRQAGRVEAVHLCVFLLRHQSSQKNDQNKPRSTSPAKEKIRLKNKCFNKHWNFCLFSRTYYSMICKALQEAKPDTNVIYQFTNVEFQILPNRTFQECTFIRHQGFK